VPKYIRVQWGCDAGGIRPSFLLVPKPNLLSPLEDKTEKSIGVVLVKEDVGKKGWKEGRT